ncbi:NAD(P)-dependent oxidoreductase [Amedibacillus sp. YH-ame10]
MKIAWIGTGVMGKAMLLHLANAGHHVCAYNRTYEKASDLKEHGIQVYETIKECVQHVDVVFTMVGYPKDVQEVYMGDDGIFVNVKEGCILIDMTTSSPQLASTLYEEAKKRNLAMLDAPVSGGDSGARNATLSIMCGGDKDIFEQCVPLFSCMGKSLNYMGPAGNGQHTKACNQIAVAGAVAAMSEAIVYARNAGLCEEEMLQAIKGGAAGSWQIEHTAPRVLKKDFEPGFYIKHFIKDMHIIQDEMKQRNIDFHMLNAVCEMYESLAEDGEEDNGTQALLHYYKNGIYD